MEGSGAERYTTQAAPRAPHPHKPAPGPYNADVGHDAMEQRPSPQSRQRSWHHPYMQATRSSHGLSPPASLEPVASSSARTYEHGIYDRNMADPHHRSPPNRSELLAAEHHPSSRGDLLDRAQPLNIVSRPAHPHDVERVGGIGPSRNRGRSNTLSLPHPDTTRGRGRSFIGSRRHSPSFGAHGGYDEPVPPPPPRSWEESRSTTLPGQSTADPLSARRHSPTFRPSPRQSPILFAPLSPRQGTHPSMPNSRVANKLSNAVVHSRGPHYHSRPGTPVSPLNMDSLSMEDVTLPSASGMAAPLSAGQQRSPLDRRGRLDYFGPAAAEWGRSSNVASDMVGSPQSGPYGPGLRQSSRDYSYRGPGMSHPDAVSPDVEIPRYHPSSHAAAHAPAHPGRGSVGSLPIHPSRADQMERERFALAQQHAPYQSGYPGPVGPPELGYQSEFAPQQSRMAPGAGFSGYPPQHAVPVDRIAHSRRRRRPPYSYSSMITQAIASSSEGRMTLREIYTWISSNFSGYPMSGPDSQGWQNTVRHNLSLGKIFIKKARTAQDIYDSCSSGNPSQSQAARGKGGWWTLHPVVLSQIRSGQRTHNDEFDDIERLVEIENAAASSDAASTSAALAAQSSSASADDASDPRRSSAEIGKHRALSRQRSYSDSMDATSAEQRRPGSGYQSSTAPVSRKTSIDTDRFGSADRAPRAMYASQRAESPSGPDMPSVLQRAADYEADERLSPYNRMRGHTIAMHETPSHHYGPRDADKVGGEHYTLTRPSSGSASIPRPLFQARPQTAEDVDMAPSPRDSKLVLQEARETLVSAKQEQQRLHEQRAEAAEGAGRMAIRGLLNS